MIVCLFESTDLFTIGAPASNPVAWGDNSQRQLGNNSRVPSSTPVQVSGLLGATAVVAGGSHSLALKSDGTVWAWGLNTSGQLGNNSTSPNSIPVQVSGLTGVTAVAAGKAHSLALKSDGTVWVWGNNTSGQLGNNSTSPSSIPVQVRGLTGATAVAASRFHTLALKSDGTVWAWGINTSGQLGINSLANSSSTPVQVSGLTGATAIAAGARHNLALKSDGTVWVWGNNTSGQLGINSLANSSSTPVQVSGLAGATAIAAGARHNLALKSDGTVWVWGSNTSGQLGINSLANSGIPVQVGGLSRVVAVSGGARHSLAIGAAVFTVSRTLPCQLSAAYNVTLVVPAPGQPNTSLFVVGGTCTFPTPGFSVELRPHSPPSPDPKILLLEAIVHTPTNPVAQVPTALRVKYID